MVAAALAVSIVPLAAPAGAQVPAARDITKFACPPDQVPEDGFGDVTTDNRHEAAIDCVAWYGVTTGTTANAYGPANPVPRAQMASFIARLIDYVAIRTPSTTDGLPAAPSANAFPCDVGPADTHYEAIQRLAASGIVDGTGDNADGEACYSPDRPVSRAQMAKFITEAQRVLGQDVPASDGDFFADDDGDTHEESIDAIAAAGITGGTGTNPEGEDLYAPGADVSRDQMASFLARTLDRLVDLTVAEPPPTATLSPTSASVAGGSDFSGTITDSRGTIDAASVGGCGISPPKVFDIDNPAGAATLAFTVAIPAGQGGIACRLDVITTFVGGGRATSSAVISTRPARSPAPARCRWPR
jgi:hypothetical protein